MAHLQHPTWNHLEEYFSAKRDQLENQLKYNWKANNGLHDMSDLIRGRLQMLDEFLELKNVFKRFGELKEKVEKGEKEGANK